MAFAKQQEQHITISLRNRAKDFLAFGCGGIACGEKLN